MVFGQRAKNVVSGIHDMCSSGHGKNCQPPVEPYHLNPETGPWAGQRVLLVKPINCADSAGLEFALEGFIAPNPGRKRKAKGSFLPR